MSDTSLTPAPTDRAWRQVLHQLNNIFASIHSSLDLALANEGRPEAKSFLLLAQESARKGALLINELRFRPTESIGPGQRDGLAGPEGSVEAKPGAAVLPASLEGSERILLAEDDPSISMLIEAVLGYRGYKVVAAANGEEAVTRYRQEGPFDLVILDLQMPKLDGWGALEQLRAQNPGVRALALSGLPFEPEDPASKRAGGFNGQLGKPFDNEALLRLVRQLLDSDRAG
jgi:CheY-like chemotaxis protein